MKESRPPLLAEQTGIVFEGAQYEHYHDGNNEDDVDGAQGFEGVGEEIPAQVVDKGKPDDGGQHA